MKEIIFKTIILIISFTIIIACSRHNNVIEEEPSISCSDGIQNGDEIGVDCGGSCSNPCPVENGLEGDIVGRIVLSPSIEYKLTGPLIIRDGGQLEIHAGTVIKAFSGQNAYIAVAQGGKIYVWGQPDNPAIITSDSENPAPGDWGGLVICGKAPTNEGVNVRSEVADIFYGGNDTTDSSGQIKYLRVEYTGELFNNSNKFNGLSLYGVGSYTVIEYVQSYEGMGDGFEFVGGTVNPKWLVSTKSGDNSISITEGWNGIGDFWYLSGSSKAGIKLTNNQNNESAIPVTTGNISNITIVGPVSEGAVNYTAGGGIFTIDNIYTSNIDLGIKVTDGIEASRIEAGNLTINNILFDNPDVGFIATDYTGPNTSFYVEGITVGAGNGLLQPSWANIWTIGF